MDTDAYALELLQKALDKYRQHELAQKLYKSPRTIRRWHKRESPFDRALIPALERILHMNRQEETEMSGDFTFIDLFAGIGGIRKGFEKHGGKCVFTSEWDSYCQKTYEANFAIDHEIVGDINEIMEDICGHIPEHDVLLAGFPCQPFSIAGVSKKNSLGRVHGFACQEQGNLFFKIADIIQKTRPAAFLLENVKNLRSHDKGKTFRIIREVLEELEYSISWQVIDAKGLVPQHRERVYIVGFDTRVSGTNVKVDLASLVEEIDPQGKKMKDILHPQDGSELPEEPYTLDPDGKVNEKYILSTKLWDYLQGYARKHKAKGNGFGFGLVGPENTSRTLSARYYKDGSEILVSRGEGKNPRRLTPRECARIMGYPDDFKIPVSDTRAYKQFGNSVVVPVIEKICGLMKPQIMELKEFKARSKKKAANG